MHFGPVSGKVQPEWAAAGAKINTGASCRAPYGASRGGYGVLHGRQPPVRTPNVNASGLGGRPAAYAAVRLDVVVV